MDHSAYRELLSALLDGELDETERTQTLAHLDGCAACRTYFAELNAMRDVLREPEPIEVPAGFSAGVMARLHEESMPQKVKKHTPWRGFAAMAACAAVVVLAASTVTNLRMGSASSSADQMTMAAEASTEEAAPMAPPMENMMIAEAPAQDMGEADSTAESKIYAAADEATGSASERLMGIGGTEPETPKGAESGTVTNGVTLVTEGPAEDVAPSDGEIEMNVQQSDAMLTLSGEGAADWLAENGTWNETTACWMVPADALAELPEGLALEGIVPPDAEGLLPVITETEAAQ